MVLNYIFKNTGCVGSITAMQGDFFSDDAIPLSFRDDINRSSSIIRAQKSAAERFDQLIFSTSLNENNVVKPPKLAQAQKRGGMLANRRL
jgi:hypothetical protein